MINILITVKIFIITGFIRLFINIVKLVIIFITLFRKIINTVKITITAVVIIRIATALHVKGIMVMSKILITVKVFNMTGFISPFFLL